MSIRDGDNDAAADVSTYQDACADDLPPPPSHSSAGRASPLDVSETMAGAPVPAHDGAPHNDLPRIPGYELQKQLGRGGMGVVYLARQTSLNRPVALKMLLGGAVGSLHYRQRFRAEAEAVAALRHPNIVQIYEVGEFGGSPYCALEYVEGGTLEDAADGQPIPPRDAAECVETLARAVQFAHDNGIVHRDLKPANVLVGSGQWKVGGSSQAAKASRSRSSSSLPTAHCSLPTLKISDFGLAKRIEHDSGMTGSGAVLGTPCYMAPEQAEGGTRAVGPPADIYALGSILYELLTGRPPFQGISSSDTIVLLLTQEPVPPTRLQPRTPLDLETICLKCLNKIPSRRYGSASELADDLRRYLNGEPIAARRASWVERIAKWSRRRPALASLIGVSIFAALALAVGGYRYQRDLKEQRSRAEDNFNHAIGAVNQMLTRVGHRRLSGVAHADPVREALMHDALQFYDRLLTSQPNDMRLLLLHAQTLELTGAILASLSVDRGTDASARFDQAAAIVWQLRSDSTMPRERLDRLDATIHSNRGRLFANADKLAAAEMEHKAALTIRERLSTTKPADAQAQYELAVSCVNMAVVAGRLNQPDVRMAFLVRSLAIARTLVQQFPDVGIAPEEAIDEVRLSAGPAEFAFLLSTTLNDLGVYHLGREHPHLAKPLFEEGLSIWRRLVSVDGADVDYRSGLARCLSNLATSLRLRREFDRAAECYREAIAIRTQLAAEHPQLWNVQLELGWGLLGVGQLYQAQSKFELALASLTDAIQRLAVVYEIAAAKGRTRLPLHEALLARADVLSIGRQRFAEALADLERVGPISPEDKNACALAVRALVMARMGDKNRALAAVDESLSRKVIGGEALFNAARALALFDSNVELANRAMKLLWQSYDVGYFATEVRQLTLQTDGDLTPLRNRDDFKDLVNRVESKPDPRVSSEVSQPP